MSVFRDLVKKELERARVAHPPINSLHEGYSVILEELDEFWEEVKKKNSNREPLKLLNELIQVAAMCERTYDDVLNRNSEALRPKGDDID